MSTRNARVAAQLREFALSHIGEPGEFSINVKLPASGRATIASGLGRPSDYGLGAKDSVIVTVPAGRAVDEAHMRRMIEESYRAVAPPTLVAQRDAAPTPATRKAKAARVGKRAKGCETPGHL